jgi:hypothetical protein
VNELRDELATFFFWLAARLEKRHKEIVVRYYTQPWAHMGKSAVTTKRDATNHRESWNSR